MFDDDDATEYDPNPLGARQRMVPRSTFRAVATSPNAGTVAPVVTPLFIPIVHAAPPPVPPSIARTSMTFDAIAPRPKFPTQPTNFIARFALPLSLAIVVVSLIFAYVLKPASKSTQPVAAALAPTPKLAIEAPVFIDVKDEPEPDLAIAPLEIDPIEEPIAKPIAKAKSRGAKPKAKKRAPIKIDATDTASPLGRMRPKR
jgi:hypothetical protein